MAEVTAVDVSDVTVDALMKGKLRDFSGNLYGRPDVKAYADEGRSFVMRSARRYDLIDFTIVGGTNLEKLDVIKVDDLFTREALAGPIVFGGQYQNAQLAHLCDQVLVF